MTLDFLSGLLLGLFLGLAIASAAVGAWLWLNRRELWG